MATRDVPDRKSHREHCQSERKRNAQKTNPDVGEGGRQYGAAASPKHEPERADEFGDCTVYERHGLFSILT